MTKIKRKKKEKKEKGDIRKNEWGKKEGKGKNERVI